MHRSTPKKTNGAYTKVNAAVKTTQSMPNSRDDDMQNRAHKMKISPHCSRHQAYLEKMQPF